MEKFIAKALERNFIIQETDSKWPYNYEGGFKAFYLTHESKQGERLYVCFSDNGTILEHKVEKVA